MRAITYDRYGGPEVLEVQDIQDDEPGVGQVRLDVRAASVNPYDFHFLRGEPLFMRMVSGWTRPKSPRLGRDVAGIVTAVGPDADLEVGDRVFGSGKGSFAETCLAESSQLATMPDCSFEEAAAVAMAGYTGLQGLDEGGLRAGADVLINGASGGIGHLAVQIAKAEGAVVTGVCGPTKIDFVQGLGADHVIDYSQGSMLDGQYDLVLDLVANHGRKALDAVRPGGTYVLQGFSSMGHVLGPLPQVAGLRLGPKRGRRVRVTDAKGDRETLERVAAYVDAGALRPHIHKTVGLDGVGDAIATVEEGHSTGKLVVKP